MLKGKTVILGVSGSIAAYKAADLASKLVKLHCNVHVIMTQNATNFIHPITFETLTNNRCLVNTFDRDFEYNVEHVSLAKQADLVLVAPATANVIAKMAHGLADDMLTTTILACNCKKMVAPAMNTQMYTNPITQDNLQLLKKYGFEIIEPATGRLACGDIGAGKLPEVDYLVECILKELACAKDLAGKKILVTAGATREALDPVRYITNHSTGKMGYAIAKAAMLRGASVTLVTGKSSELVPSFVNVVEITSAEEMFNAVMDNFEQQDIIIKAAAVADYRPATISADKVKKSNDELSIPLERTTDILQTLGSSKKEGQFLCGFCMETKDLIENAKLKLSKKHLDMIVANNLQTAGAGFGTDTNVVTILTPNSEESLELMSKDDVAHEILNRIVKL